MSWGGVRPGSGRKAKDNKRVTVTVRVEPETRDILREMKEEGVSLGRILDGVAQSWRESKK